MTYRVYIAGLSLLLCFSCLTGHGQQRDTLWKGKTPTQSFEQGKRQTRAGALLFGLGAAMVTWVALDYASGNARDEGETRAVVFVAALPVAAAGITLFTLGSIKKHKALLLLAFDPPRTRYLQPTK